MIKKISGLSGIAGLVVLFFSTSILISQLRVALDKINELPLNADNFGFLAFFSVGLFYGAHITYKL